MKTAYMHIYKDRVEAVLHETGRETFTNVYRYLIETHIIALMDDGYNLKFILHEPLKTPKQ